MALVSQQNPEHLNCPIIYDTKSDKYRAVQDTDYNAVNSNNTDAFNRLRISQPETIFHTKQIFDNQSIYWDIATESGSGTSSTYSQNTASTTLSVSNSTPGKITRQTFMRFNYQPAKSHLIFLTGVLKKTGGGANIIARMGYFDDDNGLFLENNGGTIRLVLRSKTTGSVIDTPFAQSAWNIDKMDGTGSSRITLDFTKSQILIIDFEWLGVGIVRYGFQVDGVPYYVHQINNANNITGVYMSTPNLPLRYQISNDGNGGASSIECICSTVVSEGGKEDLATIYHTDSAKVAGISTSSNNPLLGIRLKTGYKGATIDLLNVSILAGTNNANFEWHLVLNPTLSGGALTYQDVTGQPIQRALGSNSINIVSGTYIAGGYGMSSAAVPETQFKSLLKLGSSITGKMDELVIFGQTLSASATDLYAAVTYRQF